MTQHGAGVQWYMLAILNRNFNTRLQLPHLLVAIKKCRKKYTHLTI